jgi:hypothetical protein
MVEEPTQDLNETSETIKEEEEEDSEEQKDCDNRGVMKMKKSN